MQEQQVETLLRRTVQVHTAEELRRKLERAGGEGRPLRIKFGADPSAPDIHLGHVVALNKLREFQELGHEVIFIIGDFTGMIGDPSGRTRTRPPLTREEVERNARTYREQVFRFLIPEKTRIRFNSEWCDPLNFADVIRLAGRVTVAQMLARDDFSRRYAEGQPISLVEFLYPLIQAYDSVVIEADVEVGGTDQLFNMLLGRELQREMGREPQVVMTLPLLEGIDGVQKMSKSLGNYIAVNDPPDEIFGKCMSVNDELMWRYLDLVLCRSEDELARLRREVDAGNVNPRDVKLDMAEEIVRRIHGEDQARRARENFLRIFSRRQTPESVPEVEVTVISGEAIAVLDLIMSAGLAPSRSEARRLIEQGAVRIDGRRVGDVGEKIVLLAEGVLLKVGKRRFARLVPA
ncbi:MAG: tyrosine--tRNA ligase [Verrucomicrobia bacterium]|nr:MAG: tyrosine--tRNA ligase [Verrucomicrobiota bacterium]